MTASPLTSSPLDRLDALLPPEVKRVVDRETPIPTIALQAAARKKEHPELVRADIGQISNLDPSLEIYYGPPVGLDELRAVIAETWNLSLGWKARQIADLPQGFTANHVAVCTGAAEGLSLLFRCFAQNKVVGLPKGHWENYTNGVELAGGTPVLVDFFDAQGNLDIPGLREQIQAKGIGLLVANFPCNPTGAVLTEAENEALGQLLQETGILAIADEVYFRLRFDGHPPTSLLTSAPGHAIAVSSGSKEYLLPGARVGYIVSTRADLTNRVLRKLIRANSASPNVPGQQRMLELMKPDLADLRAGLPPRLITRVRDEMARRRDLLVEVLDRHGFGTVGRAGHRPEGTIFLMAGLPAWWKGDDVEFSAAALEASCVSVIPGSSFALDRCVRFSYGGMNASEIKRLDENLTRFRQSLHS